jgi:hypothetical protein
MLRGGSLLRAVHEQRPGVEFGEADQPLRDRQHCAHGSFGLTGVLRAARYGLPSQKRERMTLPPGTVVGEIAQVDRQTDEADACA